MENLYSVEEAAKLLGGLSTRTLYCWMSRGRLLRTKVGARTMLRESELSKLIVDGGKCAFRGTRKDSTPKAGRR